MCVLCTPKGSMLSCQECGISICFDAISLSALVIRAYMTRRNEVYCRRCGPWHDLDLAPNWPDDLETPHAV